MERNGWGKISQLIQSDPVSGLKVTTSSSVLDLRITLSSNVINIFSNIWISNALIRKPT